MKRLSSIVLSSILISFAMAHPTELAAGNKSDGGVSAGDVGVSAGRDGASVSAGRSSVGASASVNASRGDSSLSGDARGHAVQTGRPGHRSGDRSYDSIGEWFEDLRSSWFGGKSKGSDVATEGMDTTTRNQTNRVVQRKSSTATATDGGSAVAESSNVNVTEQTD